MRWPQGCLELVVDSAGTATLPGDIEVEAIRRAAATWVVEIGACSGLSIDIRVADGVTSARDGRSTIVFRDERWCRPATSTEDEECHSEDAIAITKVYFRDTPGSALDGEIQEADIEINTSLFALSVGGMTSSTAGNDRDLEAVVAHELGHALGLTHNCYFDSQVPHTDHEGRAVPRCDDVSESSLTAATMYFQFDGRSEDKASLEDADVLGGCAVTADLACRRYVQSVGCHSAGGKTSAWWLVTLLVIWRRKTRRLFASVVLCSLALALPRAEAAPGGDGVVVKKFRGGPTKKVRTQTLDLVEEKWRLATKRALACAVVEGRVEKRRLMVTVRDPRDSAAPASGLEVPINRVGRLSRKQRAMVRDWLAMELGVLCATTDEESRVASADPRPPEPAATEPATSGPVDVVSDVVLPEDKDSAQNEAARAETPPIATFATNDSRDSEAAAAVRRVQRPRSAAARDASTEARISIEGGVVHRTLDATSLHHGLRLVHPQLALEGEVLPLEIAGSLRVGASGRLAWSQYAAAADGSGEAPFRGYHEAVRAGVLARRASVSLTIGGERRRDRFADLMTTDLDDVLPARTIDFAVLQVATQHDLGLVHLRGALTAAAAISISETSRPATVRRAGEAEISVAAAIGRVLRVGVEASAAELRAATTTIPISDRRFVLALTVGWVP